MPILPGDLKLYLPEAVNTTVSNGGRMSSVLLDTINVENNIFNDVLKEERVTGGTTYVKLFCKQENVENRILKHAQAWIDTPTGGGDYIVIFAGTQTDTQATLNQTRVYGVATLSANVAIGDTVLPINVEHAALLSGGLSPIIQPGDAIRITDKETPTSETGNEEWLFVQSAANTDGLGMQIVTTYGLMHNYLSGARVSSLLSLGDISAHITNFMITSTNGTYNQNDIQVSNIGSIEDVITTTINADITTFSVHSAVLGDLNDGTTNTDYSVENPDFTGNNYFTIKSSGWSGTLAQGDVLTFAIHPSSAGVWQKRVEPAGVDAYSNNTTVIAFNGMDLTT